MGVLRVVLVLLLGLGVPLALATGTALRRSMAMPHTARLSMVPQAATEAPPAR